MMNEITYTMQGDYLLPDLTMPDQPEMSMGRYARMRKKFLKEHHKVRYYNLLTSCTLNEHLNDTEQQSDRAGAEADGADGSFGGRDGEPESDGYDELGSEDEQHLEPSAGDRDGGSNLRLDYYDRSHEDKSLPFFGGDDTVREILGTTPHLKASKDEIRAFFEATADEDARISYIKSIFNNDFTEVILSDGRRVGYKTYQNVLQLWEGSYLSRTAQSFYDWGVIAQHFEAMRLLGELQDTMKPLPSIDGQLSLMMEEAEEQKPSAFTFSQEIIDASSHPWQRHFRRENANL